MPKLKARPSALAARSSAASGTSKVRTSSSVSGWLTNSLSIGKRSDATVRKTHGLALPTTIIPAEANFAKLPELSYGWVKQSYVMRTP
jgi:hypothetical protein